MPLISPVSDAEAPEAARPIFQAIQAKLGRVLKFFRTLGYAPPVLQATLAMDAAIQHELDPKLRELAYLKTSQLNGCQY
jgi:alkylhydroperoxidase family enzyme